MPVYRIWCSIILVILCTYYGILMGQREKERILVNEELFKLLLKLKSEFAYGMVPFEEAFVNVISGYEGRWKPLFKQVSHMIENNSENEKLSDMWLHAVNELPVAAMLAGEEKKELIRYGADIGLLSKDALIKRTQMYMDFLDRRNSYLYGQIYQKVKVLRVLGITAGLFIAIIII